MTQVCDRLVIVSGDAREACRASPMEMDDWILDDHPIDMMLMIQEARCSCFDDLLRPCRRDLKSS